MKLYFQSLTQPLLWIFFHQFLFLYLICRNLATFSLVLFPEQHKFESRTWIISVTSTLKQVPFYRKGFSPISYFPSRSFFSGWRWGGRWRWSREAAEGRRRAAVGATRTLKVAPKHQSSPLISECCRSPFERGPMVIVLSVLTNVYRQTTLK